MCEVETIELDTYHADEERKKAASFQEIKRKLFRKQILVIFATVFVLIAIAVTTVGILSTVEIVKYEDNISVSMVNGNLIGRLRGSQINQMTSKWVQTTIEGQEENYLFFYMADTKLAELTTDSDLFRTNTLLRRQRCQSD